jgi:hypothetical protein
MVRAAYKPTKDRVGFTAYLKKSALTAAVLPPAAISCLGAFQPPAARVPREFSDYRRPKTCT